MKHPQYLLRGEGRDGTIVEITVEGTQQRERKRGHLEGQGYDVKVARLEEEPEVEELELEVSSTVDDLMGAIQAAAVLVLLVIGAWFVSLVGG